MSQALTEMPNAEPMPAASAASVVLDGRYLPPPKDGDGQTWVRTSALIGREPQELYELWSDIERAPEWQEGLVSVTRTGENTSHWVARHGDKTIEWDSEELASQPGKRIAWRSTQGDIQGAGEVIFESAPGGRGTYVTSLSEFGIGKLTAAMATLTGRNPSQAAIESLRHFKALAETGEIPRVEPQPHGERGLIGKAKKSIYGENIPVPDGGN